MPNSSLYYRAVSMKSSESELRSLRREGLTSLKRLSVLSETSSTSWSLVGWMRPREVYSSRIWMKMPVMLTRHLDQSVNLFASWPQGKAVTSNFYSGKEEIHSLHVISAEPLNGFKKRRPFLFKLSGRRENINISLAFHTWFNKQGRTEHF